MVTGISMSNLDNGGVIAMSDLPPPESDESAAGIYALQLGMGARRAAIRLGAYYRAERRGFQRGHEIEDWLAAEREMSELDAVREVQSRGRIQA
jgi:Protein of unknown function (DUF2934)